MTKASVKVSEQIEAQLIGSLKIFVFLHTKNEQQQTTKILMQPKYFRPVLFLTLCSEFSGLLLQQSVKGNLV